MTFGRYKPSRCGVKPAARLVRRQFGHFTSRAPRVRVTEKRCAQCPQAPSYLPLPRGAAVWPRIVGTTANDHYGRPFAFHQQAQKADWAAAWAKIDAPVLALYGEYDWFESRDATSLIVRIANAKSPGRGTFVEIPRMNHHFSEYPNATAAFVEKEGKVNPEPAVAAMLGWLKRIFATPT